MVRFTMVVSLAGCAIFDGETGGGGDDDDDGSTETVPQFGTPIAPGENPEPTFTILARAAKDLAEPRDLEFHPDRTDELWIANRETDTIVVLFDPGTEEQAESSFYDKNANHFLEEVSGIAFSDDADVWASCQESRNTYDDLAPPNDFMGPALWPGDLDVFAQVNQSPTDPLLGSHLDMLHQSPNCMGIAHHEDNAFWVFDGLNRHLVYYDFQEPHILGGDDHSDGIVRRYPEVELDRVANVPGHMVVDPSTQLLYIANTGAGEILAFDTTSGEVDRALGFTNEPLAEFSEMSGASFSVFADGFDQPSGIALDGEVLFVSDHTTGEIVALDVNDGAEISRIEVPEGEGIMGLAVGPDGLLYYVHGDANVAVRVDP